MSKFVGVCTLVLGFGLSASEGFTQTEGLKEILSGKTLTSPKGKTVYVLGSDGTLGGAIAKQNVVGFWDVRDGLWCRTISEPTLHEGEACRVVAVNGSEVTLSGGGQSIIYTMK
jgi:hypothetical protein